MIQNDKSRAAVSAWLAELEAMLTPLMPQATPYPDIVLEPDFRRMAIPSPASCKLDVALSAIGDYSTRQEMTERAKRLERDLTNLDIQRREFAKECADMKLANERRLAGTLSDAPEALKLLRRNLQGDIDRWRKILDGDEVQGLAGFTERDREALKAAAANSEIAAARKRSEWEAKSKGGKKGAKLAKATGGGDEDKTRKAILDEAKRKLQERDERDERGGTRSGNAIFSEVAARHMGADGKPIMSAGAIKKALQRAKSEKRGKYARTGKPRGRYKAGTR